MTLFPHKQAKNVNIKFKQQTNTDVPLLIITNLIKLNSIKTLFENPDRDEIFIDQFMQPIMLNP